MGGPAVHAAVGVGDMQDAALHPERDKINKRVR